MNSDMGHGARLKWVRLALFVPFLLLCSLVWGQDRLIQISYEPMWEGTAGGPEMVTPIRVYIENFGDNDAGEVTLSHGNTVLRSFVELPSNTAKAVDFYLPKSHEWQPAQVRVLTRQGVFTAEVDTSAIGGYGYGWEEGVPLNCAYIGDEFGSLAFLKVDEPEGVVQPWSQTAFTDVYGRPGELPTRSVAYMGFELIFLGDGAERLSDVEVMALQGAALTGSKLVFVGGAAKPILNDPRWAGVLPVTTTEVRERSGITFFDSYGDGAPDRVTFTQVADSELTNARMDGDQLIAAWRPMGKGAVVFLAFDPFAGDMRNWQGRKGLFFGLDKWVTEDLQSVQLVGNYWEDYDYDSMSYYYGDSNTGSVFQVELPDAWKVGLILFVYVILVIPVNFMILRKMGRGELAWVTAPVFAAIFAGVFFAFSGGLYESGLSKQTNASVVASVGVPTAMAMGDQQLFFPRGGRYDLGLQGVELAVRPESWDYMPGRAQAKSLQVAEQQFAMIPNLEVTNLAFWDFSFAQVIPWAAGDPGAFRVERRDGQVVYSGSIVNTTGVELKNVRILMSPSNVASVGAVAPGEEIRLVETVLEGPFDDLVNGRVMIQASFETDALGANIGADENHSNVTLYWDVPVEVAS